MNEYLFYDSMTSRFFRSTFEQFNYTLEKFTNLSDRELEV